MWYILDKDNKPVESNTNEYVKWSSRNPKKRIVKQETIGNTYISTVFLGLDHSFRGKIPVLWETMMFGGQYDQNYQERYSSYEDAVKGHQKAINFIKKYEL
jgi:hypothetical protein